MAMPTEEVVINSLRALLDLEIGIHIAEIGKW
jgi:hypothetical protein